MGQAGDKTQEDKGGYDDDRQGLGHSEYQAFRKLEFLVIEDLEAKLGYLPHSLSFETQRKKTSLLETL